jgi:MFS family permease
VSFVVFGGSIGAVLSGSIAEKIGRKASIIVSNLLMMLAIALLVFMNGITVLCIARIVLGLGMGITMMVGQVFISESAPNELRGPAVASFILLIFIGFIVSHISSLIFAYQLKLMFALGALPLIVQLVLMILTQSEAPTFIGQRGRPE